ncbi:MAG TPA: hypothetical protein VLS27_05395, partial [Gammaproteobacteria bacterium]|nr:hypothetical protein [Gammaproteobacteria bacterium]
MIAGSSSEHSFLNDKTRGANASRVFSFQAPVGWDFDIKKRFRPRARRESGTQDDCRRDSAQRDR